MALIIACLPTIRPYLDIWFGVNQVIDDAGTPSTPEKQHNVMLHLADCDSNESCTPATSR
jgi:hypothetical protein